MTTYKLVPVEPTPAMRKAAADAWLDCDSKLLLNKAAAALRAGIAAAPTQPEAHEIQRPYGMCSITGPAEDVAFIMRHLPDVDDDLQGDTWRSHGREDTMRHPEESDVSGGATDCVPVNSCDALEELLRLVNEYGNAQFDLGECDDDIVIASHERAMVAYRALRAHLAPIVADAERWRKREVQAEPVACQLPRGFLADVMTAAGLVSHGKQCKALGGRLGAACIAIRSAAPCVDRAALIDEIASYLEARDALDNRELMGPNAERADVLMARVNRAREHLDAALAATKDQP